MRLTSNQITFIDLTDSRTFKIYLQANVPTVQIYDKNKKTYSPSWEFQNVIITPEVYLNSTLLPLGTSGLSLTWQRQDGVKDEGILIQESGEYALRDRMTVTKNALSSAESGMITYICKARYNGLEAVGKITFCRVDHGKDADGGKEPTLLNLLSIDAQREQVELNQDISAFNYIDIYYHTVSGDYGSMRIRSMGRKEVKAMISQQIYEDGSLQHYQAEILLSGNNASIVSGTHLRCNSSGDIELAGDGVIFISVDAIYGE